MKLWLLEILHKLRKIRKNIMFLLYSLLELLIAKNNAPDMQEQISGPVLSFMLFDMMEELQGSSAYVILALLSLSPFLPNKLVNPSFC